MTKEYKFEPLTPRLVEEDHRYKMYRKALNEAYADFRVKNIAITGIYGAGKSSVWKTYQKEQAKKLGDVITISLSEFNDAPENIKNKKNENPADIDSENESKTKKDKKITNINQVEEQIINQILYQIEYDKIPLSKYKVKMSEASNTKYKNIKNAFFFVAGFVLMIEKNEVLNFSPPEKMNLISILLTLLIVLTLVSSTRYWLKKLLPVSKLRLAKINIQGNEIGFNNESDKDILNEEMRELVYLISASKVKTIVFEDLDRFENIELFTKLRELNYLVNVSIETNHKSSNPVRFIYMLRDGLFFEQKRAKFFDFIVPIVPIINANNSKGILLELFNYSDSDKETSERCMKPSKETIERISLYIDDMRILYSIRNEYEVYWHAIEAEKRQLDPNKLLGIIVLKNIFPREFDDLQQNRGYIYNRYFKNDRIRKKYINNINKRIEVKDNLVDSLNNSITNTKFELMALYISPKISIISSRTTHKNWSNFLSEWSITPETKYRIRRPYSQDTNYNYNTFYNEFFKVKSIILCKILYNVLPVSH